MDQNPITPVTEPVADKSNTAMAIIAYILFFIPLLTGDAKKDAYVKYHTKQGLVLFLLAVLLWIINQIIPFYYWWRINSLLNLGVLVLMIVGIAHAASGKKEPLPLIGRYADTFKF